MKKTPQLKNSRSAQDHSSTNHFHHTKKIQTINGLWQAPEQCAKYDFLLAFCRTQNLRLFTARSYGEAVKYGGDYALVCPFSKSVLFAGDSIESVAAFLRVEGV